MQHTEQTTTEPSIVAGTMAVVARRYAGALYALAEEQDRLDAIAADLHILKILACENASFRAIANHPRLTRAQMVSAAQKMAGAADFNALTANFLALVAQNRRFGQLAAMCDAFLAKLAAKRGEFTAEVRTAHALSTAQRERLIDQLQTLARGKVHLAITEDKTLLGGLMTKIGSIFIDASVKGRLARLERQLKSQPLNALKGAA